MRSPRHAVAGRWSLSDRPRDLAPRRPTSRRPGGLSSSRRVPRIALRCCGHPSTLRALARYLRAYRDSTRDASEIRPPAAAGLGLGLAARPSERAQRVLDLAHVEPVTVDGQGCGAEVRR